MIFAVVGLATVSCGQADKTLVLLSTNDMHARIQNFPRLATAVKQCRDTTDWVMLVDAGDRWTGNAYVDMAEVAGMPMIEMMNELEYDVATVGNHEFDHGTKHLAQVIQKMNYPVICANLKTHSEEFPELPPYIIEEHDGLKIGFIGAVTNYENNGFPAGNPENFEGISFPEPQAEVARWAKQLRQQCDLLVLVSHMGDDRDLELLEQKTQDLDLVLGGHTHVLIDTLVGKTLLTQTKKNLANVGVTVVRFEGKKLASVDFRVVSLDDYAADADYQKMCDGYYANEELNRAVGEFTQKATKTGLANWMARSSAEAAGCELGFYHIGGVRLDGIEKGGVGTAKFFDLEPFGSKIVKVKMTRDELRDMILVKYNDPENRKEAHRVDLYSTTPYTIVVDERDEAQDVRFEGLRADRNYSVALPDYVYKNYKGVNKDSATMTDIQVSKMLLDNLKKTKTFTPDNRAYQGVKRPK